MPLDKPYKDVPGTTIFDAEQSRKGYWLNQFCMSLMKAENRARFKADERVPGHGVGLVRVPPDVANVYGSKLPRRLYSRMIEEPVGIHVQDVERAQGDGR